MTHSKWILLTDDSANDAELALRALSANHAAEDVIVASDGAEALDCLHCRGSFTGRASGNPALILLDLKMPKVDGIETLRLIKSDPRLKSIPVVMFTSSGEASDVARCYELGANAYVVKPVDFKRFLGVVEALRGYWVLVNESPPVRVGASREGSAQLATAM